ncbi:hypothetical protein EJP81_13655 [Rahnella aquatilis]|nr:hypothetical protein D3Z09_14220 [Rahnella aquatilis]AZP42835.2 hypothetical protein EJP79_13650 [Rahnella aquatilis]AZP47174.1 hypothetical protein EJP81_13655 [Rahnella aquatilis]AZP51651.1 hypothetical protein EJP80_14470 [Rahnella aquatilis]
MMIPFRKKNTLSAYRSQGGGDHLIKPKPLASVFCLQQSEINGEPAQPFLQHPSPLYPSVSATDL